MNEFDANSVAVDEKTATSEECASQDIFCANCGSKINEGVKFCPECGEKAPEVTKRIFCHNCGAKLNANTKFCPECGATAVKVTAVGPDVTLEVKPTKKSRKKVIIPIIIVAAVLVVAIVVGVVLLALDNREIPVDYIMPDDTAVELIVDEQHTMSCSVYPNDATDKTVRWRSSNTKIATVNEYGVITAIGVGECEITAESGGKTAYVTVTVNRKLPDFLAVYNKYCKSTWAKLGNDYSYLSIDTNPYDREEYSMSAANDAIEDINRELGLPESLREDMGQTSWSMGKQSQTFESIGLTVAWTYHPDKGLEITYKHITN